MTQDMQERRSVISIAILAMGGEGGGVLADWILDLAEHAGYRAQSTSAPGVAQRTGATIYYIEMFRADAASTLSPVFALMPVPGNVDVVLASELMEAARGVQRGIVTPDRTTLVASTNRVFSIAERTALGDGRVESEALFDACRNAAKRFVAADMARIAERTGSVISAALFGALAGSGALPFPRAAFEDAIRRGGIGVETSLAAFGRGFDAAQTAETAETAPEQPVRSAGPVIDRLLTRAEAEFPAAALDVINQGVRRLVDYQDAAYARDYLDRLAAIRRSDAAHGGQGWRLLRATARHLAVGMSYEDPIRVAELKIRTTRLARVRAEVGVKGGQVLRIHEYMHPRIEEIVDILPAWLGRRVQQTGLLRPLIEGLACGGRIVDTTSLRGFLQLYLVASRKPGRRRTLRFAAEQRHLAQWLDAVTETARRDYDLACEAAECLTVIKGYGESHRRGLSRFEAMMTRLPTITTGTELAALRRAALADDSGAIFDAALSRASAAI